MQDLDAARPAALADINRELDRRVASFGIHPGRQGLSNLEFLAAMRQLEWVHTARGGRTAGPGEVCLQLGGVAGWADVESGRTLLRQRPPGTFLRRQSVPPNMKLDPCSKPHQHTRANNRRTRREQAAQHLPQEKQDEVEVLRLALALHSYNTAQAIRAAAPPGAPPPAAAPVLVSSALPPAAPATPRAPSAAAGEPDGLAPVRIPGPLAQGKVRCACRAKISQGCDRP